MTQFDTSMDDEDDARLSEKHQEFIGNIFDNLSRLTTEDSDSESEDDANDEIGYLGTRRETIKQSNDYEYYYSGSVVDLKELEKRAKLSATMWIANEKASKNVIVISSDDDDDEDETVNMTNSAKLKDCFGNNNFFMNKGNSDEFYKLASQVKENEDDNIKVNKATIDWFFSPKKVEKDSEQLRSTLKRKRSVNIQNEAAKKPCGNKIALADSPIAKSLFAKTHTDRSDWHEKVGASAPLLSRLNGPKGLSSLKPHDFSTCQLDFLDGLAEESMFQSAYIDAVLTFTSESIAPPSPVVMHIFLKIAQCPDRITSLKAVNCLKRFLSMRILTHRNFCLTWDMLDELVSRILQEMKIKMTPCTYKTGCLGALEKLDTSTDELQEESTGNSLIELFLFVVNLFEEDLIRFQNNLRNSILWKILSPSLYGNSRLRIIGNWMTKILQILEDADSTVCNNNESSITEPSCAENTAVNENSNCNGQACDAEMEKVPFVGNPVNCEQTHTRLSPNEPFSAVPKNGESTTTLTARNGNVLLRAMQRLFNLLFLACKEPTEEAQSIGEAFLNCFFEIRTLKWRKVLLSTIESCLIQQTTSELILSTVFEDTRHEHSGRLSLEKIVDGYFYKQLQTGNNGQAMDENIELFIFLLFILVRSYLTLRNSNSCQAAKSLSILNAKCDEEDLRSINEPMSIGDRETCLYIQEEITLLRTRMLRHRVSAVLSDNTEFYLTLLGNVLDNASQNS